MRLLLNALVCALAMGAGGLGCGDDTPPLDTVQPDAQAAEGSDSAGGADVVSAVFRNTIQQTTIPDELRGRLAAFNIFVVAGGPRLGDFEGGVVASIFSPTVSVVSGGLLCLAGVVVIAAAVPRFATWRVGDPP